MIYKMLPPPSRHNILDLFPFTASEISRFLSKTLLLYMQEGYLSLT